MIDILVVTNGERDFFDLLVKSAEKTRAEYRILAWANQPLNYKHDKVQIFGDGQNIGHGAGLDKLIEHATAPFTLIVDADCHLLLDGWDEKLIANMQKNGLDLMPAEGGLLKPIRPAFMFWRTEALKRAGSMKSWEQDGVWFDTGIKSYFTTLRNNHKSVERLQYRKSPFDGVWGECYAFAGELVAFHHYYGSRFGTEKQQVDGRDRKDFEESKKKLFNLYANI